MLRFSHIALSAIAYALLVLLIFRVTPPVALSPDLYLIC